MNRIALARNLVRRGGLAAKSLKLEFAFGFAQRQTCVNNGVNIFYKRFSLLSISSRSSRCTFLTARLMSRLGRHSNSINPTSQAQPTNSSQQTGSEIETLSRTLRIRSRSLVPFLYCRVLTSGYKVKRK
jgi:hypothetical protein